MAASWCAARVLHNLLRDSSIPFEQRLELCKKGIQCKQLLPILNNTPILLEWVIENLTTIKSDAFENHGSLELWEIFHDFLQSPLTDNLGEIQVKQSHVLSHLGPNIVQLLIHGLRCFVSSANVSLQLKIIDSFATTIKHPVFQKYICHVYEAFTNLLVAIINTVLQQDKSCSCYNKLMHILDLLLEHLYKAQSQCNHEEVFLITCRTLMMPFSQLMACGLNISEFKNLYVLKHSISNALFNKDLEQAYQKMLSYFFDDSFSDECPNLPTVLLDSLEKMLGSRDISSNANDPVGYLFPFLIESFVIRFKNFEHTQKFMFFILLVQLLGMDVYPQKKTYFKTSVKASVEHEITLNRLDKMLLAAKHHLSLNFDEVVEIDSKISVKPSAWFQALAEFLLGNYMKLCTAWYQCWHTLLQINSSIITGKISTICTVAWLSAHQVDSCAKMQQSIFFCQIVQLYAKLNQLPKLVSKILAVLSVDAACDKFKEPYFPPDVLQKFGEICTKLHPSQTLEMWQLLNNYTLSYTSKISSQHDSEHSCKPHNFFVYPAIECFIALLSNIRLVDINLPKNSFDSLLNMSESTSNACVPRLILEALKTKDTLLLKESLLLAHSWGDLHVNLLNYNEKYRQQWYILTNQVMSTSVHVSDLSVLHFYIGSHEWDLIYKACLEAGDHALLHTMTLLILQKIKVLIVFVGENVVTDIRSVTNAANHIASLAKYSDPSYTWNGEISTINGKNNDIATWSLICDNMAKLISYLSPHEVEHVADIIVSTFMSETKMQKSLNVYSHSICTSNLIKSQAFHESGILQTAVIIAVSKKITEGYQLYLAKKRRDVLMEKILNLLSCLIDGHEVWMLMSGTKPIQASKQMDPMWVTIESASKILCEIFSEALSGRYVVDVELFPVDMIIEQLLFLNHLSLEYFLPGTQMFCMFEVFCAIIPLVHCTRASEEEMKIVSLGFNIGICLIDGMRSNWLFHFVQPQQLLSWLFKSCSKFIDKLCTEKVCPAAVDEFRYAHLQFLEAAVFLIMRSKNAVADFDIFLTQIESAEIIPDLDASCYLVSSLIVMIKSLNKVRQQQTISGIFLDACNSYLKLILKRVFIWFNMLTDSEHFNSLYNSTDFVVTNVLEGFSVILEFDIVIEEEVIEPLLRLIPSMMALVSHVSNFSQNPSCLQSGGNFVSSIFKYREKFHTFLPQDYNRDLWESAKLISIKMESLRKHDNCNNEDFFVKRLITLSSETEFSWILEDLLREMNMCKFISLNAPKLQGVLSIWKIIVSCQLNPAKEIILISHSNKLLVFCQYLLHHLGIQSDYGVLGVLVIDMEAALIKNTKLTIERLALCLHCSSLLDFTLIEDSVVFEKYLSSFYLLLNNILVSQSTKISQLVPSLVSAVQDLMHSVIKKGQQNLLKDNSEGLVLICRCAQLVERLFKQMATYKLDFAKVVPCIISDFVTSASSVTLHSVIKDHLTNGIYAILDICDEKAVPALSAMLTTSGRQIFNSLYESYKLHYVYKGKA